MLRHIGSNQLIRTLPTISIIRPSTVAAVEPKTSVSRPAYAAAKPYEQIPGVKSLPLVGTSWVFMPLIGKYTLKHALQYDMDRFEKFGPIARDKFGKEEIISIHDPDDIEWVFRNEDEYPMRMDFSTLRIYREMRKEWFSSLGVMILQGKEWYDLRFRLQKNMMKTRVIERFVTPMEQVAQDLVQRMVQTKDHNNEVPDFLGQLVKWALESVAYIGLNTRLGCLKVHPSEEGMKIVQSVQDAFTLLYKLEPFAGNLPFWKYMSTPTWRKFVRTMDFFSEIAFKYANQALGDVREKIESGKEEEMTMVQSMLATKDLDVAGVVIMLVDMLMAGVDTTSNSINFLLYALAKAPEKQEKLYQEISRLLPNPSDRLTPDILRQMTYLKNCIKESQRLYPITKGVVRTLENDIVLSGYKVPAGKAIVCEFYVIHQLEKYFKNPKKFIPERWMDENAKPHPFSFLPFGFGIRSCIGRRLAELEMQCLAIEIIRKFKVEYHHEDMKMVTRLVNVADRPLRFAFLERGTQK